MRIYTGSGRSPTSSLRDDRVRVPRLNALKFLQWGGARMVKKVVEPMLYRGSMKRSSRSPTAMDGMVENEE
jgi:hypothetical protein